MKPFRPNIPAPRRSGAFMLIPASIFILVTLLSLWVATERTAAHLGYQARLGPAILSWGHWKLYAPWSIVVWEYQFSAYAPRLFDQAMLICAIGPLIGAVVGACYVVWITRKVRFASTHGTARWSVLKEYVRAKLLSKSGVVIGMLPDGRVLRDDSEEHVACIAPTRSGKGVGQVIPTLLSWMGSVLVHDMKGENWEVTSAWRARFSNVIYFDPTDPNCSAHFNPLLEVRGDENQIRDVQNIADQLVDPHGKGKDSHWERSAEQFFLGAILHLLHAELDKSLHGLLKFLSDPRRPFDQTLNAMKAHPHDNGIAHETIAGCAQAMLNKNEEERSGILSTALGFLGLYADPIVARNTSSSDFRILDLMQAEHPLSLYLVVPDSDRLRLKPLTRLMLTMITQRLTEKHNSKLNKHRLLMLIDEFPRLGKLPFFADAITHLAGYNIKVMLIMQSKSQLDSPDSYGKGNTVIEGCKTRCYFTPQDPDTAQWLSNGLGDKTEVHQQTTYTGHRLAPWLGHIMVADQETLRPLLDAAEVGQLPATDAIIFVAGFHPFQAKRLKYYEHPEFADRAKLPPLKLKVGGPYPYRPKQHPNPWGTRGATAQAPGTPAQPKVSAPTARTHEEPRTAAAASVSIDAAVVEDGRYPEVPDDLGSEQDQDLIHEQMTLLEEHEDMRRRQALDELERLDTDRHRGVRLHIPV